MFGMRSTQTLVKIYNTDVLVYLVPIFTKQPSLAQPSESQGMEYFCTLIGQVKERVTNHE